MNLPYNVFKNAITYILLLMSIYIQKVFANHSYLFKIPFPLNNPTKT